MTSASTGRSHNHLHNSTNILGTDADTIPPRTTTVNTLTTSTNAGATRVHLPFSFGRRHRRLLGTPLHGQQLSETLTNSLRAFLRPKPRFAQGMADTTRDQETEMADRTKNGEQRVAEPAPAIYTSADDFLENGTQKYDLPNQLSTSSKKKKRKQQRRKTAKMDDAATTTTTTTNNNNEEEEEFHPSRDCPICYEPYSGKPTRNREDAVQITSCGHVFGTACLRTHVHSGLGNANLCPMCRGELWEREVPPVVVVGEWARRRLEMDRRRHWVEVGEAEGEGVVERERRVIGWAESDSEVRLLFGVDPEAASVAAEVGVHAHVVAVGGPVRDDGAAEVESGVSQEQSLSG